jgi:pyridoxamine 5'-phosphate oxidase
MSTVEQVNADQASVSAASLAATRISYETAGLDVDDLDHDPIAQWQQWYRQARDGGCVEPEAMTVSTVDAAGMPDGRVVLVRSVDARGFAFFTNQRSAKGEQLIGQRKASAVFAWLELHRQVRIRGMVHEVPADEADDYFATRPRGSQIGAWASEQSTVIANRGVLDDAVAEVEQRFAGREVTRPPHWGGFRIEPVEIEFWQGRPSRLHDRLRFRRRGGAVMAPGTGWIVERLSP